MSLTVAMAQINTVVGDVDGAAGRTAEEAA